MDYRSRDLPEYPGSDVPALKVDFSDLSDAARKIGVVVTNSAGGSFYSPSQKLINIDTKTPNQRGFVSVGQLTDEYFHAWNSFHGRGKFLDEKTAGEHKYLGEIAQSTGTKSLGHHKNCSFHQLEALNFIMSGHHVPTFVWRAPYAKVREFAYAWETQY
jgi:hypothetical protein